MGMLRSRGWLLAFLFLPTGCGYFQSSQPAEVVDDSVTRLGQKAEISLAEWLALPRQELAKLAEDKAVAVARQQDFSRHNPEAVDLLPKLYLSAHAPVFAKATYSEAAGLSIPPYLKVGQKDPVVALHVAQYGDIESALKWADPADQALIERINNCAFEKNYPAEWVRLVGLTIQSAELRLAGGDIDAATEIVHLHKHLTEILDAKAAAGRLGATLLPLGRRALDQAASQWRSDKYKKSALADDVTAAITQWGDMPPPTPALPNLAPKETVTAFLGAPVTGRIVAVQDNAVARANDLLDLPVVREGVSAIVAFLDLKGQLGQLLVVYKPRINQEFPSPGDLAQDLEEAGVVGSEPVNSEGIIQRIYTAGGTAYDVNLFTRTTRFGSFIHIGPPNAVVATTLPASTRKLGIAHLDHSFEENRLALRPDANGDKIEVTRKDLLAKVPLLVKEPLPLNLVLEREPGQNMVRSFTFHWPAENNHVLLDNFLLPLWAAFGPGKFESIPEEHGSAFDILWQEGNTRFTLRLSNDDQHGSHLVIADSRGPEGLKDRLATVAANDRVARTARLAAGTPLKRLPRALHLENIHLGMPKAQALAALPRGQLVRQLPMADGVSLMLLNQPDPQATECPRQMFVRFGPDDKVAEIRVRYQKGPRAPDKEHKTLIETLKSGPNGAPESLPAPWAKLWTDLPPQKPTPEFFRWLDDLTVMTYQRDAGGIEVTLLDANVDHPFGVELPPLQFCSRGVEACNLGDRKSDVLQRYRITNPQVTAEGAIYFGQPDHSPFDLVMVWFENDKATRIVAQHKLKDGQPMKVEQISAALQETWARNLDRLGMLRRQNGPWGQVYGTYGWHDDKNRVVTHVQDTEKFGPRTFTEWCEWPVPVKAVANNP